MAVLQEDRGLKKQVKDLQSALHLANTKNKNATTEAKKAKSKCSQLMNEVTQVKNEASQYKSEVVQLKGEVEQLKAVVNKLKTTKDKMIAKVEMEFNTAVEAVARARLDTRTKASDLVQR